MDTADANGATLILATDPDADRLAVAEKTPSYLEIQFTHLTPQVDSGRYSMETKLVYFLGIGFGASSMKQIQLLNQVL